MIHIKVLHFVSGINSGGVEQFLINYTSLINMNYKVTQVIAYQHNPDVTCLEKLENAGNKCIQIHNKRIHPIKNIIDTFTIIRKEKPDVVHAHMNLLNFLPLFFAFLYGVKIRISHSHIASDNIKSPILAKFFKVLTVLFSNKLLACGFNAGKYMYGNRKFFIIYNSINIKDFLFDENKRQKIRNKLNIEENDVLVGNVGRLTNQKNQMFLINLMKKIDNDNYKLIILGNGKLQNTLQSEINKNNLSEKVILHNSVGNISDYYDAMDIFVLPSYYEGFPVSLVEAQVSGLKCIVSNSVDNTSKINDNVIFLPLEYNLWKHQISSFDKTTRKVNISEFRNFDVSNTYKTLYSIYLNEVK